MAEAEDFLEEHIKVVVVDVPPPPRRRRRRRQSSDLPEREAFLATALKFTDGLFVDTRKCPLAIHRRTHWNDDGTCKCPKEES